MRKLLHAALLASLALAGCTRTNPPLNRAASLAQTKRPKSQVAAVAQAEADKPAAQVPVARPSTEQDPTEVFKRCLRLAEAGDPEGQLQLAQCYASGIGAATNSVLAAKWWRKAADHGHPIAQLNLGFCYTRGDGVPHDDAEAVKWFRRAAEQGLGTAQSNLGICYIEGKGVPRDFDEGLKWLKKSAEQGNAEGQACLASCYVLGQGVTSNPLEAVNWNRRAAEQGNARAQGNLGVSYALGQGVPQDLVEALKWLNLAVAQGYAKAAENRDKLVRENGLAPGQIAEAERRAAAFVARPEAATLADLTVLRLKAAGSGFFITEDGYLLTAFHGVANAAQVRVKTREGMLPAAPVKADPDNDLALLKVAALTHGLPLAPSDAVKLGQPVFTIGFPNPQWQGVQPKFTRGEISSLAGPQDDPREFQISVAVQPGNSGGPLLDERGNVVGIVRAQANEALMLEKTGALPQNVNYAVKSASALRLLNSVPELAGKLKPPFPADQTFEQAVEQAEAAAVLVLVY